MSISDECETPDRTNESQAEDPRTSKEGLEASSDSERKIRGWVGMRELKIHSVVGM